jgi:uncharacterized membrane protein HdeD (DUF308 family)
MTDTYPNEALRRDWWLFLIRGLAAIALGVAAFVWPALTLAVLVTLFGAYLLVDGIFGVVHAIRHRKEQDRTWLWLLDSVLAIIVGLLTLFAPGVAAVVLLMFVAAWAIVAGVLRIAVAIAMSGPASWRWLLAVGGVLSILFGGLLIAAPQIGLLSIVWIIGLNAILLGVVFVALALQLRQNRAGEAGHA